MLQLDSAWPRTRAAVSAWTATAVQRTVSRAAAAGCALFSSILLCVLPLAAGAGSDEAESSAEAVPADRIEIIAGGQRRTVPRSIEGDETEALRERGVLPIRGATVGAVERPLEINRKTVAGPARARLRERLDALIRVHRETFGLTIDAALERELRVLNPVEERGPGAPPPLRAAFFHEIRPPDPRFRRETERFLIARALHATSHAVIARQPSQPPFWLVEGLAVALEGIHARAGTIRTELVPERLERLTRLRRGGAVFEVDRLMALDDTTWRTLDDDAATEVQSMLGALLLFLLEDPSVRGEISATLRGERPIEIQSPEPAGARTALERAWREWQLSPRAAVLINAPAVVAEPPPVQRVRRELRCVPGTIGAGTPQLRRVLFCSRVRVVDRD